MDAVKAIEENANKLAELMQRSLYSIANDLKYPGLLSVEEYSKIVNDANPPLPRANELIQCVISQVKVEESQYQVFYSILWDNHKNLQTLLMKLPKPHGLQRTETQAQLQEKDAEIEKQKRILQEKDAEMERQKRELRILQQKDAEIEKQKRILQEKDAKIERQKRELGTLQDDLTALVLAGEHEEESSSDDVSFPPHPLSLTIVGEDEEESSSDDEMTMCASGKHKWIHNVCMVCTHCGYCTGHGSMCFDEEREPGRACGCGSGDSGCSKCGCCRMCAAENDHYERGFVLEEVPFEEEFEQTSSRLWRKHEKQQHKLEAMGRFVEMAEERVMVHTKERVQHGATANIDEDYFFFTKGLAVGVIKILEPMNPLLNYYECGIVNGGQSGAIGIGVGEYAYPMDCMPGWDQNSCGYHADDGKLYHESGKGIAFGPTCTDGDRMGCGVDFNADYSSGYVNVFFTKNGEQVGDVVIIKKPKHGLYPLIGLHSRGEVVQYLGHWHRVPDVNLEPVEQDPSCIVRSINSNGTHMFVDFPDQNNWTGLNSEMEMVPGIHPCHGCDGCGMGPIEGPRYHCQVCANFDFCQSCFDEERFHNHPFERINDQGQPAVYVGSPRKPRLGW